MTNGQTRQYIGARYVPIFADPVQWDDENTYEPLVMVQNAGDTYMSKQYVPAGVNLPDVAHGTESNDYWVHMSNWNAQIEAYREEVLQYNGRISTLENDLPLADFSSTNTVSNAIDAIDDKLGSGFDSTNTVAAAIGDIEAEIGSGFDSTNTVAAAIGDIEAEIGSGFDSTNTVAAAIDAVDDKLGSGFDSTDTVAKAIENLDESKMAKYRDMNVLFVGDSWLSGYTNVSDPSHPFTTVISNAGFFKSVTNFAQGGTGFNTPTNFNSMFNAAYAERTVDYDAVFFIGGINDSSDTTQATFDSVLSTLCANVKAKLPHAEIVVGCNARPNTSEMGTNVNDSIRSTYEKIEYAAFKAGANVLTQLFNPLTWQTNLYQESDSYHLTANGYDYFGQCVLYKYLGQKEPVSYLLFNKTQADSANITNRSFHARVMNNVTIVYGTFTVAQEVTTSSGVLMTIDGTQFCPRTQFVNGNTCVYHSYCFKDDGTEKKIKFENYRSLMYFTADETIPTGNYQFCYMFFNDIPDSFIPMKNKILYFGA